MDISFIIVNFKQKGLVKQCIKGIKGCNIKLTCEIIIVDNNSHDGCRDMIEHNFPDVKYIGLSKNSGFGSGNNAGIRASCGKYITIMNPDVALTAGAIERLIDFFNSHEKAGVVGPKLINPDGSIQYSCRRFPDYFVPLYRRTFFGKFKFAQKSLGNHLMKDWDHFKPIAVDWLFGAMLVIRKSALEKTGLFDESFFLYYEDLDLCRRFWKKNFEVWYVPDVVLVHYHYRLSAQKFGFLSLFNKATRIHIASSVKYFLKYSSLKLRNIRK